MTDIATTVSKADQKIANVAKHAADNAQARIDAAARRADRIQGWKARNAIAQADALEARADRRELHRQWNAEEHYAAVAMKAMKKAQGQGGTAAPSAANDDVVALAKAA